MGIKNWVTKKVSNAANKAADKVAALASLSPEQLREIEELKDAYLSEMPDPNDETAQEMTMRLLASAGIEIYNAYLPQIQELYVPLELEEEKAAISYYNMQYFRITKWVTDIKENNLEKLVNVYATLSNEDCNIALIFHRRMMETEVYLAVSNNTRLNNSIDSKNYITRITEALRGNFPGSETGKIQQGIIPFLQEEKNYVIASASNIPTEKSEKFISQTIEKLLDGIVPDEGSKEYTLILLATPIQDVEERKMRLGELYSALAPYAGWSTNYTFQHSDSTNSQAVFGVNAGVSAGIQRTQNQSLTDSSSEANTDSKTETDSTTDTETDSESKANTQGESDTTTHAETNGESETDSTNVTINHNETHTEGKTDGAGITAGVSGEVGFLGTGGGAHLDANYHHDASVSDAESNGWSVAKQLAKTTMKNITDSTAKTLSKSVTDTVGKSVSKATGHAIANTIGKTLTKGISTTRGIARGVNLGGNFGANFARSSNITATVGANEGITQNFTNYTIKHTLQVLEDQMARYEQSVALGMWDFAAYVIGEDDNTVSNVAHSYLALTQGEKSYLSQASVNQWRGESTNSVDTAKTKEIFKYLQRLMHPVFALNMNLTEEEGTYLVYPPAVTATTSLSGKELAYSLNFPQRSIVGLPVLACAEFGRNVVSFEDNKDAVTLKLGKVFHMNHQENVGVRIDKDSLTSHTFITGSTGSGKSNTVFQILNEAVKKQVKFMVVEPAKGEYKTMFGQKHDVHVYGTNPSITPLLKINPFSFPAQIHVLEHLDRLVEIFNVCWPMYAAMPAVLKNAIEKSYEDCGWNLVESVNEFGNNLYPTFADVTRNIRTIIDESEYDAENKGAYKGSLLTRLQSLCNGINGLIFVTDEISNKELFDENVIVDLSRVGSSETKSLLMGMLVLKLQEYRMSETTLFNSDLKHITVLEEAHNLLKRTSTVQSADSGNLAGKSVEMLANSIAEMRTYGEGFIIADQAPGLLDMSVIRNTNTKIIMRLPDEEDRKIVGKAANLNDDQIRELARLPKGVGAVYQNEWVQPVLCKVFKFPGTPMSYTYSPEQKEEADNVLEERLLVADLLSEGMKLSKETILREIKPRLERIGITAYDQVLIYRMLENPAVEPRMTKLAPIMKALYPEVLEAVKEAYGKSDEEQVWTEVAQNQLFSVYETIEDQTRRDIIQAVITYYFCIELHDVAKLHDWSVKGGLR